MAMHKLCHGSPTFNVVFNGEGHSMVVLMKIYQLPMSDFCAAKYSKVPKRGGAILRGNTGMSVCSILHETSFFIRNIHVIYCKQDLKAIKEAYHEVYGRDLQQDLQIYTASDFMDILVALVEGSRNEGTTVDKDMAKADVQALMNEMNSNFQEENGTLKRLFTKRNKPQLQSTMKMHKEVSLQIYLAFPD